MSHGLKFCVVVIGVVLGLPGRAPAQPCSLCSDASENTAVGTYALGYVYYDENYAGTGNTGSGYGALGGNEGSYNTATGASALASSGGSYNTATGAGALTSNGVGNYNTANGYDAMFLNAAGYNNTAIGYNALYTNSSGYGNSAQGAFALTNNSFGNRNAAFGNQALLNSKSGSYNIGLGFFAGSNITTGSNNIDIGTPGGSASESNTIRIGMTAADSTQAAHAATYIAGIFGTSLLASSLPVYVNSYGQLSVQTSSERFKTAITPLSTNAEKLQQLRPVSFHLKNDPQGAVQYGLIAEEVDKIYPELVIHDGTGQIQGIRYDELAPMLLNELQQQLTDVATLKQKVQQQEQKLSDIDQLKEEVADLKRANESVRAAMSKLLAKDERMVMR